MRCVAMRGRSLAAGLAMVFSAVAPVQAAEAPPAGTASAGDHPPREEVLHVTSRIVQASYQGPEGFVQGATLILSEDLFRNDVKIGHNGGVCTVSATRPDGTGDAQCTITSALPDGDIAFQGLFPVAAGQVGGVTRAVPAGDFEAAITGGTGRYRTARGFMHGHPVDDRTTRVEVHVIR
ncbi:allene oxide cyclase barrel-like domain-containing protein [Streptomyces sp. NPDC055103]